MGWHDGPMLGFDTETTGISYDNDHILSASLVHRQPDQPWLGSTEWINPGVPIPPASTAIHGITDEQVKLNGKDPAETLNAVTQVLAAVLAPHDKPLIGMNVVFDLTMLDRNCRRHGVPTLSDRLEGDQHIWPVVDVYVLDKHLNPYRKGKRRLQELCIAYNIPQQGAHDSLWDAVMAMRVAWRMARVYPRLGDADLHWLTAKQIEWKQQQDREYARYRRETGKPLDRDDGGAWPILPAPALAVANG